MQVFVYRSTRRVETYVYLPRQDDFSDLPPDVARALGRLEFALSFTLTPERRLARADPAAVIEAIRNQGFFLQLPPKVDDLDALYDPARVATPSRS